MNESVVLWTARFCVAAYLLRYIAVTGAGNGGKFWRNAERLFWTVGWVILIVHTLCAFHFIHGWSHDAAVIHTALQTEMVMGITYGGGVWFNYAMIALWGWDVALLWQSGGVANLRLDGTPSLHRFRSIGVQVYLALMVICATVVFGPIYWRGVGAAFVFAVVAVRLSRRKPKSAPHDKTC